MRYNRRLDHVEAQATDESTSKILLGWERKQDRGKGTRYWDSCRLHSVGWDGDSMTELHEILKHRAAGWARLFLFFTSKLGQGVGSTSVHSKFSRRLN